MTQADKRSDDWDRDVATVAAEIASRLRARGIAVHDSDSPDDLEQLMESVEAFERAVQARGGDLMVDEPPPNSTPQPDDPHFLLRKRVAGESVSSYVQRLRAETTAVREHRPHR